MDRSSSTSSGGRTTDEILRECLDKEWKRTRRPSQQSERRPSTVVNEDGCIVQRGFLIPNRTSSSSPRASQPATPSYKPIPAFERPTGSLLDTLEMRPLVKDHSDSLHRPTKSAGDLAKMSHRNGMRPPAERRQTWQSGAVSSAWTIEELAEPMAQPSHKTTSTPNRDDVPICATKRPPTAPQLHRSKGMQQNLQALGDKYPKHPILRLNEVNAQKESKSCQKEDIKLVAPADAEDAIASDSEDDDVYVDIGTRIATQDKRKSYAERRMIQDERAAEEYERRMAEQDAQPQQQVPQKIRLVPIDQHESAIESDDEEDDENDHVSRALRMASFHSNCNMLASSQRIAEPPATENTNKRSSRGDSLRSSLSVKITSGPLANLAAMDGNKKDGVTPREIKSFEKDAPIPIRKLRPSKSRPRPQKGVLKKTGSMGSQSSSTSSSSEKHVQTTKRPSFASVCRDAVVATFTQLANLPTYWQKPRS